MQEVADELRGEVAAAVVRLQSIADSRAGTPPAPGKWCPKEILGHLIDSAMNNHQRFVRGQLTAELVFPGYAQDEWVARQGYRERPWPEILDLWQRLNLHLAHTIERLPAGARSTACRIGEAPPATLEWWVRDYLRHLRHHLAQILS